MTPPASRPPLTVPRSLAWGLSALLIAAYVQIALGRYLINDDYQTLYTGWLQSLGLRPGQDFFVASFYVLTDLVSLLFRAFPESLAALFIGRFVLLGVLGLVTWLVYRLASRLFDPLTGAFASVLVVTTTTLLHRGLDLRPDLITTALWLGALELVLSGKLRDARMGLVLGLIFGANFVNRFKALTALPWVLLLAVAITGLESGAWPRAVAHVFRTGLWALVSFAGVVGAYVAYLALVGDLDTFLAANRALLGDRSGIAAAAAYALRDTARGSLEADAFFWGLTALGLGLRIAQRARFSQAQTAGLVAVGLLALTSIWMNPAYYSYNLVTLQPLLAPLGGYALVVLVHWLAARSDRLARWAPTLGLLAPVVASLGTLGALLPASNTHQLAFNRFLLEYTPPGNKVFALEGFGLFRRSLFHWRMPSILRPRYERGEWSFAKELEAERPEFLVLNYRLPFWLTPEDRAFVDARYVPLTPLILVTGYDSGGPGDYPFDLFQGGLYEVVPRGEGHCALDGLAADRTPRELAAGPHRVSAMGTACRVQRYYPPEARALLENPERLPYYTAPDLSLPQSLK